MADVVIRQIRLGPNGRLRMRPAAPATYPNVYRDASRVRWDAASSELHVVGDAGADPTAEFAQIVTAVDREYGDLLRLSPSTDFVSVPEELIAAMKRLG